MRRVFLPCSAAALCFFSLVLPEENRLLATRVEHFFVASDQAQALFTYFDNAFIFNIGPRIRLIRAESPGILGIVLSVRSIGDAEKFLRERRLLAEDNAGHIAISPAAIDGLAIGFTTVPQAREPANPLLGHCLGVDHVGIAVRDLEKTTSDYEMVLGFKCRDKAPPFIPR